MIHITSRLLSLLIVFHATFIVAMDSVKQSKESFGGSTANAVQGSAPHQESGSEPASTNKAPVLALSQEEFDDFSLMICANDKVYDLLAQYLKKNDVDVEHAIRLFFIDYALIKNSVRIRAFITSRGGEAQAIKHVAKIHCNGKKLDNCVVNKFNKFWKRSHTIEEKERNKHMSSVQASMVRRKDTNDLERDRLIDVICTGDIKRVEELVRLKHVDLNGYDVLGHAPLMYAVIFNYFDIAKLLSGNGASLECIDSKGVILPMFVNKGFGTLKDEKSMRQLLRGVTPNIFGPEGRTPLMCAVATSSTGIAQALIQRGANIKAVAKDGITTAYSLTIRSDMRQILGFDAISFQLKHQAELAKTKGKTQQEAQHVLPADALASKVAAESDVYSNDPYLLLRIRAFQAIDHVHIEVEGEVSALDALRIHHQNSEHNKAMRRIISFFKEKNISKECMLEILKRHGEEKLGNHIIKNYGTLFSWANECTGKQQRMIEIVIDAIRTRDLGGVQKVLEEVADVNDSDINGWPPLFYAILLNEKPIVQALIQKKADVNFRTTAGTMPLVLAWDNSMKHLLHEAGARLDYKDAQGNTPLATAIKSQQPLIAQAIHDSLHEQVQEIAQMAALRKKSHVLVHEHEPSRLKSWVPTRLAPSKKKLARERADVQKKETEKKKHEGSLARKELREKIKLERDIEREKDAQEQSLMHKEDQKMLMLMRIMKHKQEKIMKSGAFEKWRSFTQAENKRLAGLELERQKQEKEKQAREREQKKLRLLKQLALKQEARQVFSDQKQAKADAFKKWCEHVAYAKQLAMESCAIFWYHAKKDQENAHKGFANPYIPAITDPSTGYYYDIRCVGLQGFLKVNFIDVKKDFMQRVNVNTCIAWAQLHIASVRTAYAAQKETQRSPQEPLIACVACQELQKLNFVKIS